jgi:hypothetical protein
MARYEKMSCRSTFEVILQTLTCGTTESATERTLESLAQVKLGRPRVSNPGKSTTQDTTRPRYHPRR